MTPLRERIAETLWAQYAAGYRHLASCGHIPDGFGDLSAREQEYWFRYADALLAMPGIAIVELPDQTTAPAHWHEECLGAWPAGLRRSGKRLAGRRSRPTRRQLHDRRKSACARTRAPRRRQRR